MSKDYLSDNVDEPTKTFNIKLPQKKYRLRCIDAKKDISKLKEDSQGNVSGGNPMIVREYEVIDPEIVTVKDPEQGELKVNIAGLKVKDWLVLTPKTKAFVVKDSKRFDVNTPDDEDTDVDVYKGKEIDVILSTTITERRDEETGEKIEGANPYYNHKIIDYLN